MNRPITSEEIQKNQTILFSQRKKPTPEEFILILREAILEKLQQKPQSTERKEEI